MFPTGAEVVSIIEKCVCAHGCYRMALLEEVYDYSESRTPNIKVTFQANIPYLLFLIHTSIAAFLVTTRIRQRKLPFTVGNHAATMFNVRESGFFLLLLLLVLVLVKGGQSHIRWRNSSALSIIQRCQSLSAFHGPFIFLHSKTCKALWSS